MRGGKTASGFEFRVNQIQESGVGKNDPGF